MNKLAVSGFSKAHQTARGMLVVRLTPEEAAQMAYQLRLWADDLRYRRAAFEEFTRALGAGPVNWMNPEDQEEVERLLAARDGCGRFVQKLDKIALGELGGREYTSYDVQAMDDYVAWLQAQSEFLLVLQKEMSKVEAAG